ncbi:MAG: hypothetical protein DIU80_005460 [Chloroflexota bacterium]|nr:MAG: hypothetical protein DIU80_11715 [Chloroflexota bacterium]
MRKIAELAGAALAWRQPSMSAEYELLAGGELAATLRFRSAWGSLATAESADGCWTFKRVGFWQTRVTVRRCEADEDIAEYKHNTWSGGGTLTLAGGREYQASTNLWQTEMTIAAGGEPLLRYRNDGVLRLSGSMEILPDAARLPELPWMAMFGWYLVVMMYRDAGTVAATTVATIGS